MSLASAKLAEGHFGKCVIRKLVHFIYHMTYYTLVILAALAKLAKLSKGAPNSPNLHLREWIQLLNLDRKTRWQVAIA